MKAAPQPKEDPRACYCYRRLKPRWWFLENFEQFEKFAAEPVAQAYEIIARHAGFRHWLDTHNTLWNGNRPPERILTWPELSIVQRQAFWITFRHDIDQLDLAPAVSVSPKRVGFNCLLDSKSICRAIQIEMDRQVSTYQFERFYPPRTSHVRINAPRRSIKMANNRNPDPNCVTIRIDNLIQFFKNKSPTWDRDNLLETIRWFLKNDLNFRNYRRRCLKATVSYLNSRRNEFRAWLKSYPAKDDLHYTQDKYHERRWKEGKERLRRSIKYIEGKLQVLHSRAKNESRHRILAPFTVAMGIIAHDWKRIGQKLTTLTDQIRSQLDSLAKKNLGNKEPQWRYFSPVVEIHLDRVQLPLPPSPTPGLPAYMTEQEMITLGYRS